MVKEIRPAGIPRCIRRMAFSITVLFPAVCCGQNPLRVELSTIAEGNTDWDWMQARTAYVPLNPRQWLTTMSRTSKIGSHGYHDVYVSISANSGVCRISDGESWLTVAEGRVSDGERRGEVNNVILAKITQQ